MSGEITLNNDSTQFVRYLDATQWETITVKCSGLGAAEYVSVAVQNGADWVTVYHFDPAGATNNEVRFTGSGGTPANVSQIVFEGDYYRFSANTDPAGTVVLTARPGRNRTP